MLSLKKEKYFYVLTSSVVCLVSLEYKTKVTNDIFIINFKFLQFSGPTEDDGLMTDLDVSLCLTQL